MIVAVNEKPTQDKRESNSGWNGLNASLEKLLQQVNRKKVSKSCEFSALACIEAIFSVLQSDEIVATNDTSIILRKKRKR